VKSCTFFAGVDFKVKMIDAYGPDGNSKKVKATIWDTGEFPLDDCRGRADMIHANADSSLCSLSPSLPLLFSWPRALPHADEFLLPRRAGDHPGYVQRGSMYRLCAPLAFSACFVDHGNC
jgi:hypothetical protein